MKLNYYLLVRVGFVALVFSILLTSCGGNKTTEKKGTLTTGDMPTTYVRKNASTPEAAADLAALALAIGKMKELPCDSVRSWYYQAAIHSIPDTVLNQNPLCSSYIQMNQMKSAWMGCTHDTEDISQLHFLIWHRLYTWHLEKIIREMSGKKDFALPYWDYTNPQYRVMPQIFRDVKSTLYESGRLASLNAGLPINSKYSKRLDMSKTDTLTNYSTFNETLESSPHGFMHNYVGAGYEPKEVSNKIFNRIYQSTSVGGLMGDVPSAAFDPIFWVHHANIDYLWQKWDASTKGAKPILASLIEEPWPYNFFDVQGNKVDYSVEEAYNQAFAMDYTYDVLQDKPKLLQSKKPVPENRTEIAAVKVEHAVNGPQSKLLVKVSPTTNTQMLKSLNLSRKATILEVTVAYTSQPSQDYEVYVDTDKISPAKYAGVMTFFGAMHMREPGKEHTKVFSFDVSNEFDLKNMKGDLKLLIVNSSGKKATEITVKKVRLETRNF